MALLDPKLPRVVFDPATGKPQFQGRYSLAQNFQPLLSTIPRNSWAQAFNFTDAYAEIQKKAGAADSSTMAKGGPIELVALAYSVSIQREYGNGITMVYDSRFRKLVNGKDDPAGPNQEEIVHFRRAIQIAAMFDQKIMAFVQKYPDLQAVDYDIKPFGSDPAISGQASNPWLSTSNFSRYMNSVAPLLRNLGSGYSSINASETKQLAQFASPPDQLAKGGPVELVALSFSVSIQKDYGDGILMVYDGRFRKLKNGKDDPAGPTESEIKSFRKAVQIAASYEPKIMAFVSRNPELQKIE